MTPEENLKFLIHAHHEFYVRYPEGTSTKKWHEERVVKSKGFLHAITTLAEVTLTSAYLRESNTRWAHKDTAPKREEFSLKPSSPIKEYIL